MDSLKTYTMMLCLAFAATPLQAEFRVESVGARNGLGSGVVSTSGLPRQGDRLQPGLAVCDNRVPFLA